MYLTPRFLIFIGLLRIPAVAATSPGVPTPTNQWTDRKEYDLVLTIRSEASPQKRIALLDSWSKNYAHSELAKARLELYLSTYESLGDRIHMFEIAKQILVTRPDDPVGVYWAAILAPQQPNPVPETIDVAEKSGTKLAESLNAYFANDKKAPSVSEAEWQKEKLNVEVLAQRTLGWVEWQRGNFGAAEEKLTFCLTHDPNNAEISSWLGIVSGLDSGKQVPALWHLARATSKEEQEPLPEEQRRQANTLLEKMYASYHGSLDGLDQLIKGSASSPFPPTGFAIDPATVIAARRAEAELSRTNPELAAWLAIRRQLEAANGEEYFASDLRNKPLPRLMGTVVRSKPARNGREITLAMDDAGHEDVVLEIPAGRAPSAAAGNKLAFQGTAESFNKEPFTLVVTVEPGQVAKEAAAR